MRCVEGLFHKCMQCTLCPEQPVQVRDFRSLLWPLKPKGRQTSLDVALLLCKVVSSVICIVIGSVSWQKSLRAELKAISGGLKESQSIFARESLYRRSHQKFVRKETCRVILWKTSHDQSLDVFFLTHLGLRVIWRLGFKRWEVIEVYSMCVSFVIAFPLFYKLCVVPRSLLPLLDIARWR